jgi:cytochrome c-type protein NapB
MQKFILLGVLVLGPALALAQQRALDNMRGPTPLDQAAKPVPMANPDNSDVKRVRNYAMQPPVIPHKIEGYQIDRSANRCMMCHARTRIQQSQAPAISVTHYMNRDGNFLAELSPRRYFCLQCHVPQANLEPLVQNNFKDVDSILNPAPAPAKK